MAVFDRRYRPWDGARTTALARVLVLPRFAYRDVFSSRLFTSLYAASFVVPLGCAFFIWGLNNAPLLAKLNASPQALPKIEAGFFLWLLSVQMFFAAAQTLVIGPSLVSPDLVNGALPLYLSRPVSRGQYVLGKLFVLGLLLSSITWIPGLALYGLQSSLAGLSWGVHHTHLVVGLVLGSLLGIAVLSVLALAVSAFVRRRAVARGAFIGFLVITAAVGESLNEALRSHWGSILDVFVSLEVVFSSLLGAAPQNRLPLPGALLGLLALVSGSLVLLFRRLRAVEVVR